MNTDRIKGETQVNAVTGRTISAVIKVSNVLGCGFLERVNENEFAVDLGRQGRHVRQRHPIPAFREGVRASGFFAK